MFKNALKIMAPFIVGCLIILLIVTFIFGINVAINTVIPVVIGISAGFIATLYFDKKQR